MNSFLFFLFVSVIAGERITNATVEVYYDSHGGIHLGYGDGFVNNILNPEEFRLSAGYGKATFDVEDHDITLLNYYPLPEPKEELAEGLYSPMYNNTIRVVIFRGADRKNSSKCLSVERMRSYVKYVELGMRLWTANQIRMEQGKDLYISDCLKINESIYETGKEKSIMDALIRESNKTKTVPKIGIRWFITDNFPGVWSGLGAVGNPTVVGNSRSNYWAISKGGIGNNDDKNNGRVLVIIHEFGHNCGYGHSGTKALSESGIFYNFDVKDNYGDCGSYMSNCNTWPGPPTSSQYIRVTVRNKPEPWQFRNIEAGKHTYRIYAFDHPYSRYYLGVSKPFHNDSDVFDGIAFKFNCLAVRLLVNTSFTSKYEGKENSSAELFIEYRQQQKLQSSKDFGVRILTGSSRMSGLLDANVDGMGWAGAYVLPGIDYYPSDFDTGTLRIRVTKIHKTTLKDSLEEEVVKEDKRDYDEPCYAEVEIECYPNKKPSTPSPPSGLPTLTFSPSFYNCINNNDKGYNCSKSTTNSGWYYFVNNNNRNKNIPRSYTSKNAFIRGRKVVRSYNGNDLSNSKVCYGDSGSKCITITVKTENYKGVRRSNFPSANVSRIKLNDVNATDEDLGIANVIYGTGIIVPDGGRAYITDLYGNEKDIKVVDKVFCELLPALETDGFTEGAVVVKDKDGKVTYYNGFTLYNQKNGNRVAVEFTDDNEMELSPAVMPSDKHSTTTSMLFSKLLKANTWYNYPILFLGDKDYIFIDFKGVIPSGLVMTAETDMGDYVRDLSDLDGLNNTSYKLTFKELNKATGGWGEIDRIKFNKDVKILNIRPIYESKVGNQIVIVNAASSNYNYDGYKYTVKSPNSGNKYIYTKVNVEVYGKKYSFDSSTKSIKLTRSSSSDSSSSDGSDSSGLSGGAIAGIIIGVAIILVIVSVSVFILLRRMKVNKVKVDVSV